MAQDKQHSRSRIRRFLFVAIALSIGIGLPLVMGELLARLLEPPSIIYARTGYLPDPQVGWLPPPGIATFKTREFDATYDVNSDHMNDRPVEESLGRSKFRLVALGDSFTYAAGVSQQETWPNVLERDLFGGDLDRGTVYNLGVISYSVGQYLLRMRQMIDRLKPQVVLVGFSMATDLYDIIPPRMGGSIYGEDYGRVFFDLAKDGALVETRDYAGKIVVQAPPPKTFRSRVSGLLSRSALYRRARRSNVALAIERRFRGVGNYWGGMTTALKKNLDDSDRFRWQLLERILEKLAAEAREKGATPVVVNLPYLPQVYDEVWNGSFGSEPETYDRFLGGKRLAEICARHGLGFVDPTPRFIAEVKRRGTWLHFPADRHPTVTGHQVIAAEVDAYLRKNGLVPEELLAPEPQEPK